MDLSASIDRILKSRDLFGELFYEEFFDRCPEAKPYFEGHDMKRQALVMTMTLQSVKQYHEGGYPAVQAYLEHLGTVHKRRGIPMDMYPQFRSAMLHVIARLLNDEWDRALRAEWEIALDKAQRAMLEGYERPKGI